MTAQEYFDATALPFILAEEGGFNPADPSMHGILQTNYDRYRQEYGLPWRDVRLVTPDEVYNIYLHDFYAAGGAQGIADTGNLPLALVHFDAGVNHGLSAANAMLAQSGGDAASYLTLREQRYRALAASQPLKHGTDLPVWLRRLDDVRAAIAGGDTGGAAVILTLLLAGVFVLARVRHKGARPNG